jgi:hypothetical protein
MKSSQMDWPASCSRWRRFSGIDSREDVEGARANECNIITSRRESAAVAVAAR